MPDHPETTRDIVERLERMSHHDGAGHRKACAEAAGEIRRLREALDDITRGGPTVDAVIREDWQTVAEWQRKRAEEALDNDRP